MGLFHKLFGSQIETDVGRAVERVMHQKLHETLTAFSSLDELTEAKGRLQEEVAGLRRAKTTLAADVADERKKMEEALGDMAATTARDKLNVEHALGLERMRMEQEQKVAEQELRNQRTLLEAEKGIGIREAKVEAKEEATKEARDLMDKQIAGLTGLVDTLTEALPSAKIITRIKSGG